MWGHPKVAMESWGKGGLFSHQESTWLDYNGLHLNLMDFHPTRPLVDPTVLSWWSHWFHPGFSGTMARWWVPCASAWTWDLWRDIRRGNSVWWATNHWSCLGYLDMLPIIHNNTIHYDNYDIHMVILLYLLLVIPRGSIRIRILDILDLFILGIYS